MSESASNRKNAMDRRAALAALGGVSALAMAHGALGAQDGGGGAGGAGGPPGTGTSGGGGGVEFLRAGWDAVKGEYVVPPLPYDAKALEPHLDEQTMLIHHGKHHAGYVAGANKALGELKKIREGGGDAALIKHWSRELSFHLGGHVNHMIFWNVMAAPAKGVGGEAWGAVGEAITRDFGSFGAFARQFQAAANAVEGSGWGWLCYEPVSRKLIVMQGEKQQDMLSADVRPILGVDVWEHAYYLKYQNKRADYVAAFMNVINWNTVNELHAEATRGVVRAW